MLAPKLLVFDLQMSMLFLNWNYTPLIAAVVLPFSRGEEWVRNRTRQMWGVEGIAPCAGGKRLNVTP